MNPHRDRDTGRKWASGAEKKRNKKKHTDMLKKIKPLTSFFNISSGTNTTFDAGASTSQDVSEKLVDILSDQSETSLGSLSFVVSNSEVSAVLLPDTHEKDFEMNLSQESSLASNDFVLASNPQLHEAQQDITDVVIVSDDPALWPISFNERERVDIVKKGPSQVKQINFKADKSGRRFNTSFYTRVLANGEEVSRSWLVYSIQNNSVFCFCCKIFSTRKICLSSTEGYSDWKNIGSSLKQHDKSQDHISCMQKWMNMSVNLKSNATIDQNLQRMIENEKKHWRLVLERLFAIVLMLAERSLPFRGHREQLYQPNNGNFLAQVELIAKFDPVMLEHLKRIKNKECFDTYLGKDVQNEIIGLISRRILKTIVSSVQSSKYFSVIMDCTPDVSHKEQLSILLRCVKINQEEVQIEEFFCGFFHITDSTGSGLVEIFLNLLAEYNLDLMNCRGQSYDNGANMRGQYKGVQALIKEKNPRALYVPCANHTFNLMVCDAAKSVSIAINFFGTVQRIFTFFAASTVRWDILQSVCKMTVKSLSDTRWESRINSIKVVKDNLVQIIEALYKVADSSSIGVAVSEANGLANEISSYQFILSLTIWHDILYEINKVSKVMQNPSADISIMIKLVETTNKFLESFRSDESFEAIIKKSEEIAIKLGTEPVFPQVRLSRKRRFFEYEGTDTPLNGKSKYKVDFFNAIIDVALVSLNERFKMLDSYNKIFGFLTRTEKMRSLDANELLNDCKNLEISLRNPSTEESDVNHEELYSEINTFLRMEASAESKDALEILKYITANSLIEIFPNLFIALRILLTSPISVASAERSFSKLKLIKNYLRSTLGQDRLSALALISIENKISRSLDCSDLIDEFASLKVRKVKF